METSFKADFSTVRVHEGPETAAMGAVAYTQGSNIHFAPGRYDPDSTRGQELIGHELAHVVQQSQGRVQETTQAKGAHINHDAGLEREADELGVRAARGETRWDRWRRSSTEFRRCGAAIRRAEDHGRGLACRG